MCFPSSRQRRLKGRIPKRKNKPLRMKRSVGTGSQRPVFASENQRLRWLGFEHQEQQDHADRRRRQHFQSPRRAVTACGRGSRWRGHCARLGVTNLAGRPVLRRVQRARVQRIRAPEPLRLRWARSVRRARGGRAQEREADGQGSTQGYRAGRRAKSVPPASGRRKLCEPATAIHRFPKARARGHPSSLPIR